MHIALIAAAAQKMAQNEAAAERWMAYARQRDPNISAETFLHAFPFSDPAQRTRITEVLKALGV